MALGSRRRAGHGSANRTADSAEQLNKQSHVRCFEVCYCHFIDELNAAPGVEAVNWNIPHSAGDSERNHGTRNIFSGGMGRSLTHRGVRQEINCL